MEWNVYEQLSKRWCDEGEKCTEKSLYFLIKQKGKRDISIKETRFDMAAEVKNIIKEANENNEIEELRERFPASTQPFIKDNDILGQAITSLLYLSDEKFIFKAGENNGYGKLVLVDKGESKIIEDGVYCGASDDKETFVIAYYDYIKTYNKEWQEINTFDWPKGTEGYMYDFDIDLNPEMFKVAGLVPFSKGEKVLLISYAGVFVLDKYETKRLYPCDYEMERLSENELSKLFIQGIYGAISPDELYISLGAEDSEHRIFDAEDYMEIADLETDCRYGNLAVFDESSQYVLVNSNSSPDDSYVKYDTGKAAQFYMWDVYDENDFVESRLEFEDEYKFCFAIPCDEGYILGDALGYIRLYSLDGEMEWEYYAGTTISGMDMSEDKSKLLVGTKAGMIHLLDLNAEEKRAYDISTAYIREIKRWIAWKSEDKILQW